MENGLTVAKFLTYITLYIEKQLGSKIGVNIDKMQTLKVNSSSKAMKFNWKIIFRELEVLNINLTDDEKTSISQGDHQEITNLLVRMRDILKSDISSLSFQHRSQISEPVNDDIPNDEESSTK